VVRVVARGALGVLPALVLSACSFDLEKLYTAGTEPTDDAGVDASVPDELIELFRDSFAMSDECVTCARANCATENDSCRADEDCTGFTACIAERDTPAQRELCRARYASWLGESEYVLERDVNGPYGSCVLSQYCADVCRSHEDVSCLDTYTWPSGTGAITYRLRLTDIDYAPVTDARVRVCGAANNESIDTCSSDIVYTSDENGVVDLPLQLSAGGGFVGYLEIEGGRLVKQLVRFGWPVSQGAVMNLPVIDRNSLGGVFLVAQGQLPPEQQVDLTTRGMVQVRVSSCSGVPLDGAVIKVLGLEDDPKVATWYAGSGSDIAPSFSATETNDLGAAGTINIPPSRPTLQVSLAGSGRIVSDMTVPIRAGYITTVLAVPYRGD
jgi:hypothetical protein